MFQHNWPLLKTTIEILFKAKARVNEKSIFKKKRYNPLVLVLFRSFVCSFGSSLIHTLFIRGLAVMKLFGWLFEVCHCLFVRQREREGKGERSWELVSLFVCNFYVVFVAKHGLLLINFYAHISLSTSYTHSLTHSYNKRMVENICTCTYTMYVCMYVNKQQYARSKRERILKQGQQMYFPHITMFFTKPSSVLRV